MMPTADVEFGDGHMIVLFRGALVNPSDPRFKFRKIVGGGLPDDIEVYSEIVMSDLVTHSGNLAPSYFRMCFFQFR